MKSTTSRVVATAASAIFLLSSPSHAQINTNPATPEGCFSSADGLSDQGFWKYQSSGYCKGICVKLGKPVFAMNQGSHCYCGDKIPSKASAATLDDCNTPCVGFPSEKCGGANGFSVFLSGISDNVPQVDGPSSATPSGTIPSTTSTGTPSTITQPGQTVVVTASGQPGITVVPTPSSEVSAPSGPNKAGIAAGVVVAIVLVGALILGVWLFIRNRKKRAIEEEYRRNVAINSFTQKSHHASSSMSDSRLEPSVIGQRRQSDGSIADNQDYSRRILKV
ncbi:MAG: hypothetical protein M1814_001277 [Vezdaea aestivalis]|nr:MAG: hypothetical protein M1814_001277 [Vezdaea aestivalis]